MNSLLRTHIPSLLFWIVFVYIVIVAIDLLVWKRVRWPANLPSAVGAESGCTLLD